MSKHKVYNIVLIVLVAMISLASIFLLPNNIPYYRDRHLVGDMAWRTLPKLIVVGIPILLSLGCSIVNLINKNKKVRMICLIVSLLFVAILLFFNIFYLKNYLFSFSEF